jgi:hypothetical protein
MEVPVEETIGMWDDRPVESGPTGLMQLQTEEFNGIVEDDAGLRAFYVRGRIVHIESGSIEQMTDGILTASRADDAGVAMLAAMRTLAPEARAKYYTHKTPLNAVDDTLRSGGFTGYVCLAEQVVSGAYFLVYHNGKRMPVAYVGTAPRTVTGEDAFELAVDEVGIYEVFPTEVEVRTVDGAAAAPEPEASTPTGGTPQIDLQLDMTETAGGVRAGASDAMAATERSSAPADVSSPTSPTSASSLEDAVGESSSLEDAVGESSSPEDAVGESSSPEAPSVSRAARRTPSVSRAARRTPSLRWIIVSRPRSPPPVQQTTHRLHPRNVLPMRQSRATCKDD